MLALFHAFSYVSCPKASEKAWFTSSLLDILSSKACSSVTISLSAKKHGSFLVGNFLSDVFYPKVFS